MLKNHFHFLTIREFKWNNKKFSDDFRGNRWLLIPLNSLNVESEIWIQFLRHGCIQRGFDTGQSVWNPNFISRIILWSRKTGPSSNFFRKNTIDNYLITTFSIVNDPYPYTHTSLKLKFILRGSRQYPFEFLRVSVPKPAVENGIPKKSLYNPLSRTFLAVYCVR